MQRLTRGMMVLAAIMLLAASWMGVPLSAAAGDDESAILALVDAMESAVIARDRDAYLSYVDLSDPVFASEHTYWADDWANSDPLDRFSLAVDNIQVNDDRATAELTIQWAVLPLTSIRIATYPVVFVRDQKRGWLYAGEYWQTTDIEHFRIHVFAGMESYAEDIATIMPEIYTHATQSLGYMPAEIMSIKLYDSPESLGATIALSLPPIGGWNEPGESLKLRVEPGSPPSERVLAHELTHFILFDMAGTSHGNMPWWLGEGVSEYVASEFWADDQRANRVALVQMLYSQHEQAPWDQISDFETTPLELWQYVYPQGYVFARYVTEVYGEEQRNAWLQMMSGPMLLEEATETALGLTFDELDQGFGQWLEDYTAEAG